MDNRTILNLSVVFVMTVAGFFGGFYIAGKTLPEYDKVQKKVAFAEALQAMPDGGRITVREEDGKIPEYKYEEGKTITATAKTDASRIMSMFGLSAGEVVSKDQGIGVSKGGEDITMGQAKGMGILESLWLHIKDWFKVGALIIVVLLLLLMVPAASPFAGAALRWIASIFPFLGSVVERLVSHFQFAKPLEQTVVGGQTFKDNIQAVDWLTTDQKDKVCTMFNESHVEATDTSTQKKVQTIKVEKGL